MLIKKIVSFITIIVLIVSLLFFIAPSTFAGGDAFASISAGMSFAFAIKNNGELWAWGWNRQGQLGNGTADGYLVPTKVMDGVSTIAAGGAHTLIIMNDNTLWACGGNEYGQLGDGTKTIYNNYGGFTEDNNRYTPTKIMEGVSSVSAGEDHNMAIKTDGSLWAWGKNNYYQLGDGTATDQLIPIKIMDGVSSVSAGYTHTMAVKTDGSLWVWGGNNSGQLGDGTTTWSYIPIKVMDDVASVSAGDAYSLAVKTDGSLWAWGRNSNGTLGDGTTNWSTAPIKVMDDVVSVSAGYMHTMAIKADGSLWAWGSNGYGQLGDGTTISKLSPVRIIDGVVSVSVGWEYTIASTIDNSLWAWGHNNQGQLGDGTNTDLTNPKKIMEDIKPPIAAQSMLPITPQNSSPDYIYDKTDLGEMLTLPTDLLTTVVNRDSAVSAIQTAIFSMTAEQKQSATGIDLVTLYAEEAVAQAASTAVSGGIVINQTNVEALQATANDVRAAAEQTLAANGVVTQRDMQADVKFKTNDSASVTITIEPSAINTTVDNVRVETPDYALSFSAESIKANAGDSPLVITITEGAAALSATANPSTLTGEGFARLDMPGNYGSLNTTYLADDDTKTYTITFNKPVEENVKVSLSPASGDPTYQAVTNSKGDAVGGKYNPITNKLEVKIKDSDTYKVRENKKDFSDIESKSQEMQNAINILASKGIINGTTATTFAPDSPITRSEIAALIVRTLSHLDPNADGGFADVQRSDWYFGAVGSAKKFGIVNGTTPTTFAPRSNIQKDQIVAICARTLRSEMKYKNPSNVSGILSVYTDSGSIAQWGLEDIALATRENLVVRRTDGTFNGGATMTRGDAAIILYRMFMKIW